MISVKIKLSALEGLDEIAELKARRETNFCTQMISQDLYVVTSYTEPENLRCALEGFG